MAGDIIGKGWAIPAYLDHRGQIALVEGSGVPIPTRFCFRNAGYDKVIKRHRVRAHYVEEVRHVKVSAAGSARLRREIYAPQPVVECDVFINISKTKHHQGVHITGTLKNMMGLCPFSTNIFFHLGSLKNLGLYGNQSPGGRS